MTIATPDTFTESDLTFLNEYDYDVPCEASRYWHKTNDPAAWVIYWVKEYMCCDVTRPVLLACNPCRDSLLTSDHSFLECMGCGLIVRGPVRRYISRMEPLK